MRKHLPGKITFPILPQGTVLTDRDDGTLWLITHNTTESSSDDLGYIAITDEIDRRLPVQIYEAYSEPTVEDRHQIRLFVRGGNLGMDIVDRGQGITDIDNAPIYSRMFRSSVLRHIYAPIPWNGDLAWTPVDD